MSHVSDNGAVCHQGDHKNIKTKYLQLQLYSFMTQLVRFNLSMSASVH